MIWDISMQTDAVHHVPERDGEWDKEASWRYPIRQDSWGEDMLGAAERPCNAEWLEGDPADEIQCWWMQNSAEQEKILKLKYTVMESKLSLGKKPWVITIVQKACWMSSRNKEKKKQKRMLNARNYWERSHEQNWKIFTLQYKCVVHLTITSLLLPLTKMQEKGRKIQKTSIKDVGDSCMKNS